MINNQKSKLICVRGPKGCRMDVDANEAKNRSGFFTDSFHKKISERIDNAVRQADTTKKVIIGANIISQVPICFKELFGDKDVVIVADKNTYPAAGKAVMDAFISSGKKNICRPLIIEDEDLYAEYRFVKIVTEYLSSTQAVPVAVGSGTINDLVKASSHNCNRPYMVVATAASMDGYTAFGASITVEGFKQTLSCPAPKAVVADVNVILKAPVGMNASGYADLIAKIPAGADWIIADALEIEKINEKAWLLIQPYLRQWTNNPLGIKNNDKRAVMMLMEGLIMSGLAMQASQSSRPASGAEHQFSHLWDNEHHTYKGLAPSHGFKVGIGSICSEALYENILKLNAGSIKNDVETIKTWWPDWKSIVKLINDRFENPILASQIIEQRRAKYISVNKISDRLQTLVSVWPNLQSRLRKQLLGASKIQEMIKEAGAASLPTEIGIDYQMLRKAFRHAQLIRKRYTVLDLALEMGAWQGCVDMLFSEKGFWGRYLPRASRIVTIETKADTKTAYQKA